jgi:hypothetical protein
VPQPRLDRTTWRASVLRVLCFAAVLAGLLVRLVSLHESLWLDELSTLWSVEAGFGEMLVRVPMVMGLTPFYFAFAWASIHTFGESEWALRLPSLIAVMGAASLVAVNASILYGRRAAVWTALLFWLAYPAIWASVDARPYAFPMLFGAALLLGWTGVCLSAGRLYRTLWAIGTAGLVWSNLVFAPFVLAAPIAYAAFPSLRRRYTPRQFVGDGALTVLLLVPAALQLLATLDKRWATGWALEPSHFGIPALLVPFALAMLFPVARSEQDPVRRDVVRMLWISIAIQVVALEGSALIGMSLLASRYAYVIVVPAALIAGIKMSRLKGADVAAPAAVFAMATGVALYATYGISGSLSGAGYQEWREAVRAVRQEVAVTPGAPVLFRSGNAQDDLSEPGTIAWPATLAPLRSPGETQPDWDVLLLTYRWNNPLRAAYFDGPLADRLGDEPVFYLLCVASEEPESGGYCPRVEEWVATTWPGRFTARRLGSFRQLITTRFDRR